MCAVHESTVRGVSSWAWWLSALLAASGNKYFYLNLVFWPLLTLQIPDRGVPTVCCTPRRSLAGQSLTTTTTKASGLSTWVLRLCFHLPIMGYLQTHWQICRAILIESHLLSIKTTQYYANYIWINLQGFIMMPFLCYYLQVHDCMIAILGSIFISIIAQWQCDIICIAYL